MTKLLDQLNHRAWSLAESTLRRGDELKIFSVQTETAATVLDFGIDRVGSLSGGIALARISMADLADVRVVAATDTATPWPTIQVATDHPLLACVASQYAGWPLGCDQFFSMCSGPARLRRGQEELLNHYQLQSPSKPVVGILETSVVPTVSAINRFAEECGVSPADVLLCVARTASLPGTTQVVSRSIETTMHKLHELGFDLRAIRSAMGSAPLPPIGKDDLISLGWTNDAILYGATVQIWVDEADQRIQDVGQRLPSSSSNDFGTPFLEIFERYDRDFYKIDKMLFSPAMVIINSLRSGTTHLFGHLRNDLLVNSFGITQTSTSPTR